MRRLLRGRREKPRDEATCWYPTEAESDIACERKHAMSLSASVGITMSCL